jgi:hypothetical protein
MWNPLRSFLRSQVNERSRSVAAQSSAADLIWHDTVPLIEVVEGNEESDCALWENSVAASDSQLPGEADPVRSVQTRSDRVNGFTADVFGSVGKNSS